jgi:hypothetical protein
VQDQLHDLNTSVQQQTDEKNALADERAELEIQINRSKLVMEELGRKNEQVIEDEDDDDV